MINKRHSRSEMKFFSEFSKTGIKTFFLELGGALFNQVESFSTKVDRHRVARFFFAQHTKMGKLYQMTKTKYQDKTAEKYYK
jgi:hypothetical protein